jgi:hypothetical protein
MCECKKATGPDINQVFTLYNVGYYVYLEQNLSSLIKFLEGEGGGRGVEGLGKGCKVAKLAHRNAHSQN